MSSSAVMSGVLKFKSKLNARRKPGLDQDPSIKKFEHLVRGSYTVIGHLDGHLRNVSPPPANKKRHFIAFLINCNFVITMIRSLMYFGTGKNPRKLDMIGDYFWALGLGGDILHFWFFAYSILTMLFRIVMLHSEKTGHLDILTDFMVLPGQSEALLKSTLSPANFEKFCYRSKRCIQFFYLFTAGIIIPVNFMHLLGMFLAYQSRRNLLLVLHYMVWLMSLQPWLYYACSAFTVVPSVFYLSSMYVKMRFTQINDKSKVLDVQFREANGKKSIGLELELDNLIHEHHEVTRRVKRYNYISKWVLFGFNFICGPIAAISLFVPIYGQFANPIFGAAIFAVTLQIIGVIIFFASVAGGVYNSARLCYSRLNSIKNTSGHRMDKVIAYRLKCLIQGVGSETHPISLFCYDLFAYTNNSFFQFVLNSGSFFFLVADLLFIGK